MNLVKFTLRTISLLALVNALLGFSSVSFAGEPIVTGGDSECGGRPCDEQHVYTPPSIVTVYVPDSTSIPPKWQGNITSQLIDLAKNIVSSAPEGGNDPTNFSVPLSENSDAPTYLVCYTEGGDQSPVQCYRSTDSEIPDDPDNPNSTEYQRFLAAYDESLYRIECNEYTDDNEHGVACDFITETGKIEQQVAEQLNIAPNSNLGGLVNSFLSCLNGASETTSAVCDQLINALDDGNTTLALQLVQSITPLNPESASNLSRDSSRNVNGVISQRTAQLRAGNTQASNIQTQLFFTNNQWLQAGSKLAANDSLASDVTPGNVSTNISDFGKLGFFVNVNITDGKYKDGSLNNSSDFTNAMLTLGFDYRVRNDLVTGLAFNIGQSKTKYKSSNNSKLDAENYSFIVYNSYFKDNWYLDTSLSFGGDAYEQTRNIVMPSDGKLTSQFHTMQYNATIAAGYDFYIQSFSISPFVQVSGGQVHIDAYREKVNFGPGVPIEMDKQKRSLGSANLGLRFRYIANTSSGVFIPNLSLTAVNDFKNEAQNITGRYVGVVNSQFNIKTEKSDKDYFIIGAGFSFQLKNGNSGFLSIENLQGYKNLEQNRFTFGWRWEL